MNFDVPTLLSVFGVILTIIFFIFGYRQTIGARKERARGANKGLVDALFKRLTLEPTFLIDVHDVEKMILGGAISASINISDMYDLDDLEALTLSRIVESDYISPDQRQEVLGRLSACFKKTPGQLRASEPILSRVEGQSSTQFSSRLLESSRPEAVLALAAALASTLVVGVTGIIINKDLGPFTDFGGLFDGKNELFLAIVGFLAAILGTIIVLILITRLRESSRSSPENVRSPALEARAFELSVYRRARELKPDFRVSSKHFVDFEVTTTAGKYAVETRSSSRIMPINYYKTIVANLEERCKQEGYEGLFVVFRQIPKSLSESMSSNFVKVGQIVEFLQWLTDL